jgi:alkanesulfonate monooxygenase SsuD/methylene tetrahydromethanopterin reductase-like flavin-dependent oxidoreductase (luciferase family)
VIDDMQVYSVTPETVPADAVPPDCGTGRPAGTRGAAADFRGRLTATAEASERAGWSGMLVPHNLREVDPWMVASYLGAVTGTLVPLIAVQPACTPPHTAAACAAAYAALFGRPLYFNLVAGAREDELRRIGDTLGHDERYDRLHEYARVLGALLRGERVDAAGGYYRYTGLVLEPCPDVLARCRFFVAGSSPASLGVARDVADVVVTHPAPVADWKASVVDPLRASGYPGELAIRIGILARPRREDAWATARQRFPETWLGQQETLLKTRSANVWSQELATRAVREGTDRADDPYWLGAFRSGRASAPFLVGSYEEVADRLAGYLRCGVRHVLLNGGLDEDFADTRHAIGLARARA